MVRSFCYGVCMAFIGLRPLAVGTIRASIVEKALVSSLNDKVAMNSDLVGRFSTGGRAGVVYAAGARESSMEAVGRLASVVADKQFGLPAGFVLELSHPSLPPGFGIAKGAAGSSKEPLLVFIAGKEQPAKAAADTIAQNLQKLVLLPYLAKVELRHPGLPAGANVMAGGGVFVPSLQLAKTDAASPKQILKTAQQVSSRYDVRVRLGADDNAAHALPDGSLSVDGTLQDLRAALATYGVAEVRHRDVGDRIALRASRPDELLLVSSAGSESPQIAAREMARRFETQVTIAATGERINPTWRPGT